MITTRLLNQPKTMGSVRMKSVRLLKDMLFSISRMLFWKCSFPFLSFVFCLGFCFFITMIVREFFISILGPLFTRYKEFRSVVQRTAHGQECVLKSCFVLFLHKVPRAHHVLALRSCSILMSCRYFKPEQILYFFTNYFYLF